MKLTIMALLLAACGGDASRSPTKPTDPPPVVGNVAAPTSLAVLVPKVASRAELMTSGEPPMPLMAIVDETTVLRVLKPTEWAALAGTNVTDVRYADDSTFDQVTSELRAQGRPINLAFEMFASEPPPARRAEMPRPERRAENVRIDEGSGESGGSAFTTALQEYVRAGAPSAPALPDPRALVAAAADVPAARVVGTLWSSDGVLLAALDGEVRPLKMRFLSKYSWRGPWTELIVSSTALAGGDPTGEIVILHIEPSVSTQRLVDVLVELQARKVKFVAFDLQ